MRILTLESGIWLPKLLKEVFPFFTDARNLELLTPPWLRFEVLEQSRNQITAGTRIGYRLRLRGIPIRWQSRISVWDPPKRFVDEQIRGPYRLWIHEHRFEERDGMTLAEDFVRYAVPGGRVVERLFVGRDVRRIFRYRRDRLQSIFGTVSECPEPVGQTSPD